MRINTYYLFRTTKMNSILFFVFLIKFVHLKLFEGSFPLILQEILTENVNLLYLFLKKKLFVSCLRQVLYMKSSCSMLLIQYLSIISVFSSTFFLGNSTFISFFFVVNFFHFFLGLIVVCDAETAVIFLLKLQNLVLYPSSIVLIYLFMNPLTL